MTTPYSGAPIFQNSEKEQRQRIASTVAPVILLTGVLISIAILYIAITTLEWRLFVLYGGNLLFLILVNFGLRQIQKKNTNYGILLITGSIQVIIALLPALFKDIGVAVGLISFLMASLIISQTLETGISRKIMPISALASLLTIMLGYLPLSFRILAPSQLIITLAIVAFINVIILIVIVWMQFRIFNIKTKLVVAFVTLLVTSVVIPTGYNVMINYRIQRAQLSADLQNDLSAKRSAMVDFLEGAKKDVILLSQVETLRSYIDTGSSIHLLIAARAFRELAENRKIYEQIRFLNNTGEEIIRVETGLGGKSSIVSSSELRKKEDPYSVRDFNYFTQNRQLSMGDVLISPLGLDVYDNQIRTPYEPVIRLGTPVVIDNQIKGIIIVNVYAENFLKLLSASDSNTFLVDANGYYLFHTDEAKRWGQDLNTGITINKEFPGLVDSLYSGKPGNQEIGDYLITYAPITIPGESTPRWYIGTFSTRETTISPILTSTFAGLNLLLLTMVISIFVTTYLSSTITTPLGNLAMVAQDVAGGNLSARANIETKDEVGTLAEIFNFMTSQLQELIANLEARVAERTTELETEKRQVDARAKQFEAITKVARSISATQDLQELLPQISRVISEQFGFYHVGIFLNDFTNRIAMLSAANSEGGQRMLARGHQLKIGEQGIVWLVIGTGQPRIALDVGDDAVFFDNPDLPNTRSEMALPLRIADKIIGALDVQSTESNAFSSEDVDVLSTLADQVSVAIQNARLFEQIGKALAESEVVSRQYLRESWGRLSSEHKLTGFRYTASGAFPLDNDKATNDGKAPPAAKINDERPYVKIPIQLRGETIGALKVHAPETGKLTDIQLDLIKAVAERVALSVENARLFEETEKRAERERRVSDITTKIRSANDPQQMINTAIAELRQALGATLVEVVPQRLSDMTDK